MPHRVEMGPLALLHSCAWCCALIPPPSNFTLAPHCRLRAVPSSPGALREFDRGRWSHLAACPGLLATSLVAIRSAPPLPALTLQAIVRNLSPTLTALTLRWPLVLRRRVLPLCCIDAGVHAARGRRRRRVNPAVDLPRPSGRSVLQLIGPALVPFRPSDRSRPRQRVNPTVARPRPSVALSRLLASSADGRPRPRSSSHRRFRPAMKMARTREEGLRRQQASTTGDIPCPRAIFLGSIPQRRTLPPAPEPRAHDMGGVQGFARPEAR